MPLHHTEHIPNIRFLAFSIEYTKRSLQVMMQTPHRDLDTPWASMAKQNRFWIYTQASNSDKV